MNFLRAGRLKLEDIGGGVVRRQFTMRGKPVLANTALTAEEVMSINPLNRMALIDKGFIAVWPAPGKIPERRGERIAVHMGGGHYDVIEGRKLNEDALTREEAKALAAEKPPH